MRRSKIGRKTRGVPFFSSSVKRIKSESCTDIYYRVIVLFTMDRRSPDSEFEFLP